jgi:hypothetical protein
VSQIARGGLRLTYFFALNLLDTRNAPQYCSVSATNLTRGRVWGVWGVWGEIISSQFLLFPLFPIPVSTDNLLNLTVLQCAPTKTLFFKADLVLARIGWKSYSYGNQHGNRVHKP